jgi:Zn-dependent metalloprotease
MSLRINISLMAGLIISGLNALCFALDGPVKTSRNSLEKLKMSPVPSDTLIIRYDAEGTTPIFISGKISENPSATPSLKKTDAASRKRVLCRQYLSQISTALRIAHPAEELSIDGETNDNESGTAHYKIRQKFKGIAVLGAEATLHLHDDMAEFVGRTIPTPDLTTIPTISAGQAVTAALSELLSDGILIREFNADEMEILDYSKPAVKLIIFPPQQASSAPRLAYQVLVRPNMLDWWECVIDAQSAEVLLKYNRTCDVGDTTANVRDLSGTQRLIHTYLSDKFYLIDASRPMYSASKSQIPNKLTGAIVTYDYQNKYPATSSFNLISSTQNTWDAKAASAQYNAAIAFEYYRTTHNRNSIDGNGGTIRSFINVADQNGKAMDNAYWNGRGMYYGNGSTLFTPLAAALDVAGHELTHGVVEATAALRYIGQSGALNESFADIFGCMIERENWTIGESIVRSGSSSKSLRDLSNPHNGAAKGKSGWQPQSMSEYQKLPNTSTGDNGGVHVNCGITNYAYFLFAKAVGKETAERVFYRTLTTYLNASSQFADLRISSRLACGELYGKGSPEDSALISAFDSVGILDNTQPFEHIADLPVNPGKEFVLLTAAPPASDGTTLYIADSLFGSLKSISKRPVKFRPSISDDGKKILFVSGDGKLISLDLNGTTATEIVIDSSKIWSLCALSRDGLRFAAVRSKTDTAIYIGSINGGSMRKFNLNGPADNNSHAVTGAVNSTALEWNFSSDEVIYDVYNSLAGQGGMGLTFWDIGFLRSWDPDSNSFGDGEVNKLFSNLGDGISVGNPTFSKNSPNIIAYENVDNTTGMTTVMTMNMENRKTTTVATPSFPGYPSYSKRDDKIAFSTINGSDTVISVVKLKTDKQTADGSPTVAIRKMKWAIYYATGTRALTPTNTQQQAMKQSQPVTKPDLKIISCKGVLTATISGATQLPVRISIVSMDGKTMYHERVLAGSDCVPYTWNGKTDSGTRLGHGMYFIRMKTPRGAVARKMFFY